MRKSFDDQSIEETLKYVLSDMNVQLMSWGTTRIKVNGEKKRFQHLVRKVGIEVMWRNYGRESQLFSANTKKVGRTLFCSIVSRLTKGDIKQRACVDYKLHALEYENVSTINRIIEDHVREMKDRRQLKKQLNAVKEYLKYSYVTHVKRSDDDPCHDTKFALKLGLFNEQSRTLRCRDCKICFKYLNDLRSKS